LIKLWLDDFHHTVPSKMSPEVYAAIIDESHQLGLRVAAHVYYLEDAKRLVEGGVDVLAHGVRDQPVDDAFIEAMKQHRTWYVPTLDLDESSFIYAESPPWTAKPFFRHALQPALAAMIDDPKWKDSSLSDRKKRDQDKASLEQNLKNVKALADAGIRLGFGTDSGATPLRIPGFAEHRELALLVQAGLSPVEAIHTATGSAAELLGLADRGTIAPGKRADLLIVDGNPAASIADVDKIEAVYRGGEKVAGGVEGFTP
jgi:imidazolonepropionase-like amidohydrolase